MARGHRMPRKARPEPKAMVIEDIATGLRVYPDTFVDDFTGEVRATVQPLGPVMLPKDLVKLAGDRKRQALAEQRMLLEAVGILPKPSQEPKLVAPHKPGMRVIATLGQHVVYAPMPRWRR